MTSDLTLSIDLGTTRLKVSAFDGTGRLVRQVSRRNVEHRDGDASWQSADAWWQDTTSAIAELLAQSSIAPSQIRGIGLSGRAGACIFVDEDGSVIENPWSDARHEGFLASLPKVEHYPSARYGATLIAKIQWLRQHRPSAASSVQHALYGKDFILFRLTGEAITDPSSGPDGEWPRELLESAEIDASILPRVGLPWDIAGAVTARAAAQTGLLAGTPVSVGAHDGICANVGAAAVNPGEIALTLGTHVVMRGVTATAPTGARRFYSFPPDRHVIGANALFAGRALDWYIDLVSDGADRDQAFRQLDEEAARVPPGAGGIRFLPFLRGRLAPDRRPHDRAAFSGLSLGADRASCYRAVLEGTALAVRENYDQLTRWIGSPEVIGVTGGGSASSTWVQILADVLGHPLTLTDAACEGRGAAAICRVALGDFASLEAAVRSMVKPSSVVEPAGDDYAGVMEEWRDRSRATGDLDEAARLR